MFVSHVKPPLSSGLPCHRQNPATEIRPSPFHFPHEANATVSLPISTAGKIFPTAAGQSNISKDPLIPARRVPRVDPELVNKVRVSCTTSIHNSYSLSNRILPDFVVCDHSRLLTTCNSTLYLCNKHLRICSCVYLYKHVFVSVVYLMASSYLRVCAVCLYVVVCMYDCTSS